MIQWKNNIISRLFDLKSSDLSYTEIAEILNEEYPEYIFNNETVGRKFRHNKEYLKDMFETLENKDEDIFEIIESINKDVIKESERLAYKLQKEQDTQRIERTVWRRNTRHLNNLEEINSGILKSLNELKKQTTFYSITDNYVSEKDVVGIVHLTDLHLNELVSQVDNKFDFDIASKRLEKLAFKAIENFKSKNISKVIIACTGDLIGSDRRLDEKMNIATNRSQAVFVGFKLISKFIYVLSSHFSITVFSVVGNEARVSEEYNFSNRIVTDNYDSTLHNMLYYYYENTPIKIVLGNPSELIFSINNNNILLMHGHSLSLSNFNRRIADVYTKYSKQGITLRYILCGHFHEPNMSTYFSRGGSLVGSNGFSSFGLNLSSRASQSLFLVSAKGDIDSILIDLQNSDDYKGFDISEEKRIYNLYEAKDKVVEIYAI